MKKNRIKNLSKNRLKQLMKEYWLFHARMKGNKTYKEIRTSNCKNYEFD